MFWFIFMLFIGIFSGYYFNIEDFISNDQIIIWLIYLLLFIVGISIGNDRSNLKSLKSQGLKFLTIPILVYLGSILGASFASIMIKDLDIYQSILISSGVGYYSVPSVMITAKMGSYIGTMALLVNMLREIITLVGTPIIARLFGKMAPIASGGATTMDISLPIIIRHCGKDYAIPSFISGFVLTMFVPIIVGILLAFN